MSSAQTNDRRANHGRRLSDAILRAFVDASDDAVFSQDSVGRITSWNHGAERIFGYLEAEIVGEVLTVLFPEHLRPDAALLFDTVMAGDPVDHFDTEVQRKDGMPLPMSMSLRPVIDIRGLAVAAVVIGRDITEQRLAQATLAEIETRIRQAEALAHAGSWLWDVRTGVVQWSEELHRIHGLDPCDFEGTLEAHVSRVHPHDRARVRSAMEGALTSGRCFEDEYRVVLPDGTLRWIYARAEPAIGSAGAVVGLRGIGQHVAGRGPAGSGEAL